MASGPGFRLLCVLGGLLALGSAAFAKPALGGAAPAGFRAAMPAAAVQGRALAGPRHVRPGHGYGRHRFARPGYGGGYYPGFYETPVSWQTPNGQPNYEERPEQEAIPTVVGIRRPPAAEPVLYRIESDKGRLVARVIRIGANGAEPASGGSRLIAVGKR